MQILDDEAMPDLLRSKIIVETFDEEWLNRLAHEICNPLNTNILLRSKSFENETNLKAEWYNTKYSSIPFPQELLEKMTHPKCPITHKKLDLPPPNNLIPKNFDVLPENVEQSQQPRLIKKCDAYDLWYKKDD
jgi:secreted Zn-dependent insulinase-like peptidase